MVGLLDIAPQSEKVAGVDVTGVSIKGIISLIGRFPELKAMLSGQRVDAETMQKLAPDAVAAIIAAGCGSPGDPKAEDIAATMGLERQLDFIEAIIRMTMPGGFGPFVARLEKLGVLGAALGKQADTNLPNPSNT